MLYPMLCYQPPHPLFTHYYYTPKVTCTMPLTPGEYHFEQEYTSGSQTVTRYYMTSDI